MNLRAFRTATRPESVYAVESIDDPYKPDEFNRKRSCILVYVEPTEANAILLAASQDLLNACISVLENWESGDLAAAARQCAAAVRKAVIS